MTERHDFSDVVIHEFSAQLYVGSRSNEGQVSRSNGDSKNKYMVTKSGEEH